MTVSPAPARTTEEGSGRRRFLLRSAIGGAGVAWSAPAIARTVSAGAQEASAAPAAPVGERTTVRYDAAGPYQFVVPRDVTAIDVVAAGAAGGPHNSAGQFGTEVAPGGLVTATLAVTPGETVEVRVGGGGRSSGENDTAAAQGGYNGGGSAWGSETGPALGAGSGGGASDVRRGGNALADRVIVAAGGGGMGTSNSGGTGGGLIGGDADPDGGRGGSQTVGGAGSDPWAGDGTLGQGGSSSTRGGGGGGGGGFYGGGSGHNARTGGGGGSSLVPPGGTTTPGGGSSAINPVAGVCCDGRTPSMLGNDGWVEIAFHSAL